MAPRKKNVWINPHLGPAPALLTYRKIMYDPELKLNAAARNSPIMDNREKALQYQAHRSRFGKWDTYIKHPEKTATLPSKETEGTEDKNIDSQASTDSETS
ncbi:Hypothetical Protein FCC1311_000162 [Hondaea fermentalgiana]|uniref:Uncharacterized protein n=1 Tax=Hondaea fermentalgiana TaxID=2315210 RepID=A0A2R5FYG1_9STRA|nr:Hypothetical Protein FCC1311_000162 [Hondaea fermentalgiana]|eukprot:GBG23796.1 Hypothetical Protein FCC1311_000162 [Hondaea fermentalgiana]